MIERMGTSLRLCSARQCSSSAPGLCWDLRQLRSGKPVCTGVSVCDSVAEIEISTVLFRLFCIQRYKPSICSRLALKVDASVLGSL